MLRYQRNRNGIRWKGRGGKRRRVRRKRRRFRAFRRILKHTQTRLHAAALQPSKFHLQPDNMLKGNSFTTGTQRGILPQLLCLLHKRMTSRTSHTKATVKRSRLGCHRLIEGTIRRDSFDSRADFVTAQSLATGEWLGSLTRGLHPI